MELEWDASVAESYTSGQTVNSLVSSPDSGETSASHGWFLGADGDASTDDPTFNVNTFDLDGGDFFTTVTSGNNTWMQTMHYSTNPVTYIMIYDIGGTISGNRFFTNGVAFSTGGTDIGERTDGNLDVFQDSGGTTFDYEADTNMTTTSTNILIVSMDGPNSTVKTWHNSTTSITATSQSFDTTNTDASTTSATVAARSGGSKILAAGHSYRLFALRNKATTDAEAALIITHLEARHSVDYTP